MIVRFQLNSAYHMRERGKVVSDPGYASATGQGEYSYYKPREAYALRRRIQREEQERLHYCATKGVDEKQFKGNKLGAVAVQAASFDESETVVPRL